jgi:hypothetical protein
MIIAFADGLLQAGARCGDWYDGVLAQTNFEPAAVSRASGARAVPDLQTGTGYLTDYASCSASSPQTLDTSGLALPTATSPDAVASSYDAGRADEQARQQSRAKGSSVTGR